MDVNLGYPADGYRLIQQAALYSLDDDSVFPDPDPPETLYRWGSFLFQSTAPYARTTVGDAYATAIGGLQPVVDLFPYQSLTDPSTLIISPTETVSPTFKVMVANSGNSSPPISVTVRFFDVTGGGKSQVEPDVLLPLFTGCGLMREASVVWSNLAPGPHLMRIEVDPEAQVSESLKSNNVMTATVVVGTSGIYLPLVMR
jgi:hypothetical protein